MQAQTVVTINNPYFQDFGTPTCTLPSGWQNLGPEQWLFRNFSNTYMLGGDHTTGTTCFANIDDSGVSGNPVGNLVSEVFDLTALSAATLSLWWQNSNGTSSSPATPGNPWMELRVDVSTNGGATYTNDVLVLTNEQVGWAEATVDITPFISSQTRIRFRGIETNSFRSDLSLDDISIFQPPATDVGVTALVGPTGGCGMGSENISVEVANLGALPATNFPVTYVLTDPVTGVQAPVTETFFGPFLSPGQTAVFTFATPANFSNGGVYDIDVYTGYNLDQVSTNDTLNTTVLNPTVQPPYLQTFDAWPPGNAPYQDGWIDGGAPQQWTVDANGTGSSGTGPQFDHTTGFGNYLYTETSGPAAGTEYHVLSTCIDLAAIPCPKMRFWYHMFGSTMGELHVDVSTDDGQTWIQDVTPYLDGEQQTSNGAPWLSREVNLAQFAGQVIRVRFRGITGGSFQSDMAIDDFEIYNDATDDVAIVGLYAPESGCGLSNAESVSVIIENKTCLDQNDVALSMSLNGGPAINDTLFGLFPAFTVDTFTFNTTVDLSTPAFYNIFVSMTVPNDVDATNDTLTTLVESRLVPLMPSANGDTSCGPKMFTFVSNSPGALIYWYDSMTGVNPIHIGDTFSTPLLNSSTTFYASAVTGGTDSVGPVDPGIGQGSNYAFYPDGLEFDVYNEMVLEQVTVYTQDTGTVVINIRDDQGNLIFTTSYNAMTAGQHEVPIKATLQPGEDYAIDAIGTNTGLYRNLTGAVYPYGLFGVMDITNPINNLAGTYYFFYNWIVRYRFCESMRATNDAVVNFAPVFDLGPDSMYCPGTELNLDPGYAGMPRVWSTGDTTDAIIADTTGTYTVTVTDTGVVGCSWTDSVSIDYFPGQAVDLGPGGLSCGQAVLDASIPGGSYMWSNGSTQPSIVAPVDGQYAVEVTDTNGCTSTDTVDVMILPEPSVDLGADTNSCGGPVVLNAANPALTILWSNNTTAQTLPVASSGVYSVTVTDRNGCTAEDTVNVRIDPIPFVFLGPDKSSCNRPITLDAGNPGATFNWNTGAVNQIISATTSGTYWVEVTNPQGCSATDTIDVDISMPMASAFLGPDTAVCNSYTINAGANPGSTFLWSTGDTTQSITVSQSGTYSVRVENVCETAIDAINVQVAQPPVAGFTDTINGTVVTFTNTSSGANSTYQWNFGDGNFQQSNAIQVSPVHDFEYKGTYLVTLTVTNPCGTDVFQDSVTVDGPTRPVASIGDILNEGSVSVYPNPTDRLVNLEIQTGEELSGQLQVILMDAQGRIVQNQMVEAQILKQGHVLDLQGLASGLYLVRLEAGGQTFNQRILLK
jgi:hypothetical protein